MNLTYTYDPAGNLIGRERADDLHPPVPNFSREYYNAANFLTGQQPVEGGDPLDVADLTTLATNPSNITTDHNGNITRIAFHQLVEIPLLDPLPPPAPQTEWVDRLGFTWDFRFDSENRLIEARGHTLPQTDAIPEVFESFTVLEFGYDGLGRRVWTSTDGVISWFVYDGDQLIHERNFTTDELIVEYSWGPSITSGPAIFHQRRPAEAVDERDHWFYTSPQGGFPRYAFNQAGTLTDVFQYSSMGELVFHEGSAEVGFGSKGAWQFGASTQLPFAQSSRSAATFIPSLSSRLGSAGSINSGSIMVPGTMWRPICDVGGCPDPDPGFDPPKPKPRVPPATTPPDPRQGGNPQDRTCKDGGTCYRTDVWGILEPSVRNRAVTRCALVSCLSVDKELMVPCCCADPYGNPCAGPYLSACIDDAVCWRKCTIKRIDEKCFCMPFDLATRLTELTGLVDAVLSTVWDWIVGGALRGFASDELLNFLANATGGDCTIEWVKPSDKIKYHILDCRSCDIVDSEDYCAARPGDCGPRKPDTCYLQDEIIAGLNYDDECESWPEMGPISGGIPGWPGTGPDPTCPNCMDS